MTRIDRTVAWTWRISNGAARRPAQGKRPLPPAPIAAARAAAGLGLVLLLALIAPPALPAQADNGWIGKRVVNKYAGFRLQIGNQVIDPKQYLTYRVEQVNGPWLWLQAEKSGQSGWAWADHVVPVDQAIAFFTDFIRANPGDPGGYYRRAIIWYEEKKEIDIALADLNEAIRLDPNAAWVWNNRGLAWYAKKDYDKAIADDNEAIRIDPKLAMAYNNRGSAWLAKKEYDKAIADDNEAIRIDPKLANPYYGRALTLLLARREGAAEAARAGLEAAGWRGEMAIYTVIVGHLAAVQSKQSDRAKAFLDDAAARCDKETWPYPIVKYLRGELDEPKLLAAAVDDDKRTEVHGYVGFDKLLKNQQDAARTHFQWVKEHGSPDFASYTVALAELERLEAKPVAARKP